MRRGVLLLVAFVAAFAADAMPLGARLATWGIASANARYAVMRLLPDPAECEESQIKAIMRRFADESLGFHVIDKTQYAEFRDWAIGSRARAEVLSSSQMAWRSFAMNLTALVGMPQDGDLVIDETTVDPNGKLEAVISLDGVNIGSAALESRLKTVFGVEGTTTLSPDAGKKADDLFSSDNIGLSLEPTGDGRVRATVTPDGAPASFFLRVRVK